ncbi:MAG: carboxypeptidase-like regulatory domain-containing protein [Wenzhouxiangella sp.]|nr:carboxypeptidase-like regulatory domain-containing protein [Wenzhouxiangella sp.]
MEILREILVRFRATGPLSLLAALAILLPAIASGQEATISGVVTEAGSGAPIENALVVAARNRFDLYTTTTDASGAYQLTVPMGGLAEVQIVLEAAGPDHAPTRFGGAPEVLCYFACGAGDGFFTLEPGDVLGEHDLELEPGGRLAGTGTAADTSDGLQGAGVIVYSGTEGLEFSQLWFAALTDADGHWELPLALPAGDYHLIANAFSSGNYVARAWNSLDCQTGTCPILGTDTVAVTAGNVTTGIDFTLRPGASISGTLLPDDDLRVVRVVDGSGLILETIPLLPGQSEWALDQLGGGSYYLELGPSMAGSGSLVRRLHNGLPCPFAGCERASGPPISVPQGGSLSGVDITLTEGGQLQGELIDAATGLPPEFDMSTNPGVTTMNIINADGTVVGGGSIEIVDGQVIIPPTAAVPPGEYYVRTYMSWFGEGLGYNSLPTDLATLPGYADAAFPDVACAGLGCDLAAAQTVSFSAGQITTVTISIERGSNVSGIVLDDDSGEPIVAAHVNLIDAAGQRLAVTRTNADGEFFFGAFPAGSYFLRTSMSSRSGPGVSPRQFPYFDRIHGSSENCSELLCDPGDATPLVLDGDTDLEGIEFRVTEGPVISGRIFDQFTGAPINRGQVAVFNETGVLVGRYALDFFTGAYQTTALAPGTYSIEPLVSPAFFAIPGSAGAANAAGHLRSSGSLTVVVEEVDVEANVSVIDQAIDRIFRSRFIEAE